MFGTHIADGTLRLGTCYPMPGTDIAYGMANFAISLGACYAMPGTDIAYGARSRWGPQRATPSTCTR
eukprot:865410-Rhodomonas_salina.3